MRIKRVIRTILVGLAMAGSLAFSVKETQAVSNSSAQFTISPIYSSFQKDNLKVGYYDLVVKKEKRVVPIKVRISNLNPNEKLKFKIKLGDATTTDNGLIEYSDFKPKGKLNSQYRISQMLVKKPKKIVVKAGSSKIVKLKLKLPKEDFPGTIAGGVYVERVTSGKVKKKGMVTKNHFAMTLPVQITEHPKAKRIAKMKLDAVQVKKGPVITAKLSNVKPVIFGQLMINAKIKKSGDAQTLVSKKVTGYQVAPNSSFNFLVSTGSSKLAPGKYILDMYLQSGKRKWHLVKDFNITTSQAKPITQRIKAIGIPSWLWMILMTLIVLILLLIWIILMQRHKIRMHK
ncbi:hypothetical protein C5L33_000262 [Lactobacillus pasteurii]|uniref:Cell surface protein n=2 Tax=Lactobacillus pasteurii TaxID=872327 RepID=I7LDN0_9LACO|nr:hypothetical protein C5L33_000262 [Lactobacillus pasteurii]CCI85063.1 Cell surface protein [Lactobacillus pasteurii DSM 23907 = CRBIP 24.76]